MELLSELWHRKVVRLAAACLVVGWLLVQVASTVLPALRLLGPPDERKEHVLFEAGHGALPQRAVVRETQAWFGQHL
jgi:hypothetical protein